ncbi:hypothetical protein [Bosea sp. (in: a-proteobacteria)]|uniref:hypothetical protein n=1 Tax=Bosea sp. (in: a-proteobacteria) TaxID=1871050 RepID=UPI002FC7F72A
MSAPQTSTASRPSGPHFQVGRDCEGFWIAVETHGRGGGYFSSLDAALHYARSSTGREPGSVTLATQPLALLPLRLS